MQISGNLVDVVAETIRPVTLTIAQGRIVEITSVANLPAGSPYIMPGFIDSHIHIESTLLPPHRFAPLALAQGTVAVVTDPHEITNVTGLEGINYMLQSAQQTPLHFSFGIPSCVPSTTFETSGFTLTAQHVRQLLQDPRFYGLAEMMNYPGVLFNDPVVMDKISAALQCGKIVDGHAPSLTGEDACRYISAGITTDHETFDLSQAQERIQMGMKILIREGSAARNFNALAPLLAEDRNKGMVMFCTDDIYPDSLQEGHINTLVARAVADGFPLWNVLHAACVAPVRHYSLPTGLLQQGDSADFILVDDLTGFHVLQTYIGGNPQLPYSASDAVELPLTNNFHTIPISPDQLRVPAEPGKLKVILSQEEQLYTQQLLVEPKVLNNYVVSDPENDILKLVVYNRYQIAPPSIGFIKGFGLKSGAMASTIAHDSHNIIALGVDDASIARAINNLVASQGGLSIVSSAEETTLPLPVAGLMADQPGEVVAEAHRRLRLAASRQGCPYAAPFMTLAFMALPVIPELKLTDLGLFDGMRFAPTSLFQ